MSRWSNLISHTQKDVFVEDAFGDSHSDPRASYITRGPPPLSGPRAPKRALDVVSVMFTGAEKGTEANSRKEVVWYVVECRTAQNLWQVKKRYSECFAFHKDALRVGVAPQGTDFPPRYIFSIQDDAFVAKRRGELGDYFCKFLSSLRQLDLSEDPNSKNLGRAGLLMFLDFVRASSPSCIALSSEGFFNGEAEHVDIPAYKVVQVPAVSFSILLFLPGIRVRDVYVTPSENGNNAILVGGQWRTPPNRYDRPHSNLSTPVSTPTGTPIATPAQQEQGDVLMDTLPSGPFEMMFEIPQGFDRTDWRSEYVDGVLFLHWLAPSAAPGGRRSSRRSSVTFT